MPGTFLIPRDVEAELNIDFSETSQPSTAEVDSIIEDIEAEVKGSINMAGLAVPTSASNPISYRIVHNIVLAGVCARVQAAYGGNVLNMSPREEMYWGKFLEGKEKIESNPRYLPDATDLTDSSSTGFGSSFLESSESRYDEIFKMDDEY